MQAVTLILSFVFLLLGQSFSITASAIGDEPTGADFTSYTFDELCSKEFKFPKTAEELNTSGDVVAKAMYYDLKDGREYSKWLKSALEYVEYTGEGPYIFKAQPKGINSDGLTDNEITNKWAQYETVANKMTMIMARGASHQMVGDVFGQEFDPTNAVTLAAMNTFTMICNATFNIVAKALMLLFLVQTGFDVLYLVIPALQPILAPANASSGGGQAGLAQGKKFALRFNVVSNEAVEANNRGATGSVGTNGGTGGGFLQTNIAMRYLIARAPLIIIAFTYFVLVATNVWTDIITWSTSLITGFFYGL